MAAGQTHLWLSHDGGATWTLSDPPFGAIGYCDLDFPPGGHGILVATISPNDYTSHGPVTIWISHNQGRTWRAIKTIQDTSAPSAGDVVVPWLYRGRILYGQKAPGLSQGMQGLPLDT